MPSSAAVRYVWDCRALAVPRGSGCEERGSWIQRPRMLWRTFAEPMTSRLARSQSVVDPPVADRAEPPICTLVVNGGQAGEGVPKDRSGPLLGASCTGCL